MAGKKTTKKVGTKRVAKARSRAQKTVSRVTRAAGSTAASKPVRPGARVARGAIPAPRTPKRKAAGSSKPAAKSRGATPKRRAGGKSGARAFRFGPIEVFYAQAIAIEREAASRYREFAHQMTGYGNTRTAELFQRLARFESEHAERLLENTAGMTLPSIEQLRRGLVEGSRSEVATYEFLYRRVLPHHALLMALAAERRAKAYFDRMRSGSADAEIRKLSREFAREEAEHIRWLEQALAVEPQVVHRFDDLAD